MLKVLRKKELRKQIMWLLVAPIIICFGAWGAQSRSGMLNKKDYAGKIYGKKIGFPDFERQYLDVQDQMIMTYGPDYRKLSARLNLESQTWDRILLLHEAQKRKIKVSDSEVVDFIQSLPFFQANGQFDPTVYAVRLSEIFNRRPREFEESIRDHLVMGRLLEEESSSMTITEKDIREKYRADHEKRKISYILFPPQDYTKDVTFTEDEAKQYFEAHKQDFQMPPMIDAEYVSIDYPEKPTKENKRAAFRKIYDLYDDLVAKKGDFAAVAKTYNLTPKTSGLFNVNQPNLALGWSFDTLQKITELGVGSFSEPIETPQGFLIVRIKDRKNSYLPPFDQIREKVNQAVMTAKALDIASQKANAASVAIRQALAADDKADFPTVVEKLNLKLQQTPFFGRGDYLPIIGLSKEFHDAAAALNYNETLSAPVKIAKGYCLLHFDEAQQFDEQAFQKEKENVARELITEKRTQIMFDLLAKLRTEAQLEDNVPKRKLR